MSMRNPCWTKGVDCPDRSDICAIYCEKWKTYCEERQKMYDQRKRDAEANILQTSALKEQLPLPDKRTNTNFSSSFKSAKQCC